MRGAQQAPLVRLLGCFDALPESQEAKGFTRCPLLLARRRPLVHAL